MHHRLVAPTKKTRKGKKGIPAFFAALNKIVKSITHLPGPTALNQRGGIIICMFWAHELHVVEHLSH